MNYSIEYRACAWPSLQGFEITRVMPDRSGRVSASRIRITNLGEFVKFIGTLGADDDIALGQLHSDLPDNVEGVAAAYAIVFSPRESGLAHVAYRPDIVPDEIRTRLDRAGGFLTVLEVLEPLLSKAGHATVFTDIGRHVFIRVADISANLRFAAALHERYCHAGFGWVHVGSDGIRRQRSIVDHCVADPFRGVFTYCLATWGALARTSRP